MRRPSSRSIHKRSMAMTSTPNRNRLISCHPTVRVLSGQRTRTPLSLVTSAVRWSRHANVATSAMRGTTPTAARTGGWLVKTAPTKANAKTDAKMATKAVTARNGSRYGGLQIVTAPTMALGYHPTCPRFAAMSLVRLRVPLGASTPGRTWSSGGLGVVTVLMMTPEYYAPRRRTAATSQVRLRGLLALGPEISFVSVRTGPPRHLDVWLFALLRLLVSVGLVESMKSAIARSSPGFLPAAVVVSRGVRHLSQQHEATKHDGGLYSNAHDELDVRLVGRSQQAVGTDADGLDQAVVIEQTVKRVFVRTRRPIVRDVLRMLGSRGGVEQSLQTVVDVTADDNVAWVFRSQHGDIEFCAEFPLWVDKRREATATYFNGGNPVRVLTDAWLAPKVRELGVECKPQVVLLLGTRIARQRPVVREREVHVERVCRICSSALGNELSSVGYPVAQACPGRAAPTGSRWSAPLDDRPGPGWRGLMASGASPVSERRPVGYPERPARLEVAKRFFLQARRRGIDLALAKGCASRVTTLPAVAATPVPQPQLSGAARVASAVRPHLVHVRYAATVPVIDLDAAPADASGRRTSPRSALGVLALVLVLAVVTGEPVAGPHIVRLPIPAGQMVRCRHDAPPGGSSVSASDTPDAVVILDVRTGQPILAEIHCA